MWNVPVCFWEGKIKGREVRPVRPGEGAGGVCRCRRGFRPGLIVHEGEESDLVKIG